MFEELSQNGNCSRRNVTCYCDAVTTARCGLEKLLVSVFYCCFNYNTIVPAAPVISFAPCGCKNRPATCVKLAWYSTFDIWYSTNLHHGPCASNATDIVAETQTAGDKLSSRPRPTPYFHFRYREKRRQFVIAWAQGRSHRQLLFVLLRVYGNARLWTSTGCRAAWLFVVWYRTGS